MKTVSHPFRRDFFQHRPGAALLSTHRTCIALDGAPLGLLRAKAQRAQNQPNIGQAKPHAVLPMDKGAHALERLQFSLKAVRAGLVQQCGSPRRGHGSQRVNAACIENFFPHIHRLPGHARSVCDLGRLIAC